MAGEFIMNPEFMMFAMVPSVILIGLVIGKIFKIGS